jgi:putative flippase GtrA
VTDHLISLARFTVIGLANSALGLVILVALHELGGIHYLAAFTISFVITNFSGYLFNGRYTFAGNRAGQFGVARFMLVSGAMLIANICALKLLVQQFHVWYLTATLCLAAVSAPASFAVHRLITYRVGMKS